MQDVLDDDVEMTDWLVERESKSGVVLHDRLMTDAVIGSAPIKTEHSYSLHSDVESSPPSPHHTKVDGMYFFFVMSFSLRQNLLIFKSRQIYRWNSN